MHMKKKLLIALVSFISGGAFAQTFNGINTDMSNIYMTSDAKIAFHKP